MGRAAPSAKIEVSSEHVRPAEAGISTPDPAPRLRLPRRCRLARKRDFDAVFRTGVAIGDEWFVFHARPNDLGHPRLGLAVSRRHGDAPTRNRIKRRLREAFRLDLPGWTLALDVVVIPRPGAAHVSVAEMREAFVRFQERAARRGREPRGRGETSTREASPETSGGDPARRPEGDPPPAECRGRPAPEPKVRPGPTAALIGLIRLYKRFVSPLLPPACRFTPTCSEYFAEALRRKGLVRGTYLGVRRLLRCQPFGGRGWDPVPE